MEMEIIMMGATTIHQKESNLEEKGYTKLLQELDIPYREIEYKVDYKLLYELQDLQNSFIFETKLGSKEKGKEWYKYIDHSDVINALDDEFAELRNSYPWKWWKSARPNFQNALMEIVDLLHFALTYDLIYLLKKFDGKREEIFTDDLKDFKVPIIQTNLRDWHVKNKIRDFKFEVTVINDVKWLILNIHYLSKKRLISPAIILLGALLSFSPKKILDIYKLKGKLNIFRQENGYLNGTYKKIINGKEDNEILMNLYKELGDVDLAFEQFKKLYKSS